MCGIIASTDPAKFKALVAANQSRGQFSYSLAGMPKRGGGCNVLLQDFGEFPVPHVDIVAPDHFYLIGHVQAPTGGLNKDPHRIHPARLGDALLWHNGILKNAYVDGVKRARGIEGPIWDTFLMLGELYGDVLDASEDILSTVDGTFACLYWDEGALLAFRSSAAPLYCEESTLSFSSVPFDGGTLLPADKIFEVDFDDMRLEEVGEFISLSNPYVV